MPYSISCSVSCSVSCRMLSAAAQVHRLRGAADAHGAAAARWEEERAALCDEVATPDTLK